MGAHEAGASWGGCILYICYVTFPEASLSQLNPPGASRLMLGCPEMGSLWVLGATWEPGGTGLVLPPRWEPGWDRLCFGVGGGRAGGQSWGPGLQDQAPQ